MRLKTHRLSANRACNHYWLAIGRQKVARQPVTLIRLIPIDICENHQAKRRQWGLARLPPHTYRSDFPLLVGFGKVRQEQSDFHASVRSGAVTTGCGRAATCIGGDTTWSSLVSDDAA